MRLPQILVLIQFSCILGLIWLNGALAQTIIWLGVQIAAIALGLWAIAVVRLPHLSIFPAPKAQAELRTNGPFRLIRHPMYAAVLLYCGVVAFEHFSIPNSVLFLVLTFDLLVKLNYEEGLLAAHFPTYSDYQKRSKRLIPWIW